MADFYPASQTRRSRALYEVVRRWAAHRKDVSIIGGWAVVELVDEAAQLASRDLDPVFRSPKALRDFHDRAAGWKLVAAMDKADRRAIYAVEDDPSHQARVDFFTDGAWSIPFLPADARVPQKNLPWEGLLPPLSWLIHEKLATIPVRMGTDADQKQEKDLLDVHRLVFHNRDAAPPFELLPDAPKGLRRLARARIDRCIRKHPAFAEDYRTLARWLDRP